MHKVIVEHRRQAPKTSYTEEEVRKRLNPPALIAALEKVFRERYPTVVMPARTCVKSVASVLLSMLCYDPSIDALGMKIVRVLDGTSGPSERVQATFILLDPKTGKPKRWMAANYLTDLRTAAVSGIATNLLARHDVKTLAIFGTGRQARTHLQVLPCIRKFSRILVCGSSALRSAEFAKVSSDELGISIQAVNPETCVAEADVLCTCTTANEPLFDGRTLRPGTHLNLVGAFQPHTREVDDTTVERSRVFVDTYDGALAEAGDLLVPMQAGRITRQHVLADLHELITSKKPGRISAADITLFKSVGCCLEDLVAAELVESCDCEHTT